MSQAVENLKQRFADMAPRERMLVVAAGLVCVTAIFFLAIWEPLAKGNERLRMENEQLQRLIADLGEVQPAASRSTTTPAQRNRKLLSIIDESAKVAGLSEAVKRSQPEGNQKIRVWLEAAEFSTVLRWLNTLNTKYGLTVIETDINREDKPGLVRARPGFVRG